MMTVSGASLSALLEPSFRHAFNSIVITDADFTGGGPHIIVANPAFCAMTGYSEDELIGRSPRILQGPATDPAVIDRLREAIHAGNYFFGSTVNYRKDGHPYTVEWNISAVRDGDRVVAFVSVQQDVTARLAAQREHHLFLALGNLLPTPLLVTDTNHRISFVNHAFEEATGYSLGDLSGKGPDLLYDEADRAQLYAQAVEALSHGQDVHRRVTLRHRNGTPLQVEQRIMPFGLERDDMHLSTFTDVSELVQGQELWRSLAHTDALTGTVNRRGADQRLAEMWQRAITGGTGLAVMLCDLDHFKRVNDTYGHAVGDRVLQSAARALRSTLREGDVVARHGGEEFLVLVPGVGLDPARALAERLRAAVAAQRDADAGTVTVSIGLAHLAGDADEQALLARADAALYAAKAAGRDRVVVAPPPGDAGE